MKRLIPILSIVFFIVSCEKLELRGLKGTWVEIDTKTDTIVFKKNVDSGSLYVYRGRELHNGYMLPKLGSGIYLYKILGDSISLHNMLMSSVIYYEYFFSFDRSSNTIQVGKFAPFETDEPLATFEKIKN